MWFPRAVFPTAWYASKSRVLPLPSFQHNPSSIVPPFMPLSQCHTNHPPFPSKSLSPQPPGWQRTLYAMLWCEFCLCWPVQWYVVIIRDIQGGKLLHGYSPESHPSSPPWASWMCRKRGPWGSLPSVSCHGQRAVAFSSDSSPAINLGVSSGSNSL